MLSKLEANKLLPLRLGVIKYQGKNNEINLKYLCFLQQIKLIFFNSHYKMGDKYGSIFSETLKGRNDLQKIDLSDNKLRSTSASDLFQNLNKNTRKINLSKNLIGKQGCTSLEFFMKDNKNM